MIWDGMFYDVTEWQVAKTRYLESKIACDRNESEGVQLLPIHINNFHFNNQLKSCLLHSNLLENSLLYGCQNVHYLPFCLYKLKYLWERVFVPTLEYTGEVRIGVLSFMYFKGKICYLMMP